MSKTRFSDGPSGRRHPAVRRLTLAGYGALVLLFSLGEGAWGTPAAQFRAGWARADITPGEPVPMWGYGARRDALSEGVLEPLYATALVLQAGSNKMAIVGLDLGRAPAERSIETIRRRIFEEAAIEFSFLAGSHTHHGPVVELTNAEGRGKGRFDAALDYAEALEASIVTAILEANEKLTPARLATGSVELEGFNRNRQSKLEPKPVDRELAVLRLDDASGRPLAVLVNFAAHPTMIPAATLKFSPDFIGPLREELEQTLGAPALFMQGASGDLSVHAGDRGGYREYGAALGRQAAQLAASLETKAVSSPSLVVREERFTFASRTDFANPLVRLAYSAAFFPELVENYLDEYASGVRPRLSVALLNEEIAFVGVSGEVFCQHALRLKERARVRQLFFFSCCNGYHQYFPTIEAAGEGGYGADSRVAPAEVGAGEQLMNTALIWLYQMRGRFR